jgi:hypothetical protein
VKPWLPRHRALGAWDSCLRTQDRRCQSQSLLGVLRMQHGKKVADWADDMGLTAPKVKVAGVCSPGSDREGCTENSAARPSASLELSTKQHLPARKPFKARARQREPSQRLTQGLGASYLHHPTSTPHSIWDFLNITLKTQSDIDLLMRTRTSQWIGPRIDTDGGISE